MTISACSRSKRVSWMLTTATRRSRSPRESARDGHEQSLHQRWHCFPHEDRNLTSRTGKSKHVIRTSIQASSLPSAESSLVFAPLTATRLLGGAISSALPNGLFLSSIFGSVAGRGEGDGVVATGIRKEAHEPVMLREGSAWQGL